MKAKQRQQAMMIGIGVVVIIAAVIFMKKKKKKKILADITGSGEKGTSRQQWDTPSGKCHNKDFWEGYHYDNPAADGDGHIPTSAVGEKIFVYRKDYKLRNGAWIWINPMDKKDIDTTIDSKTIAELNREAQCLSHQ